MGFRIVGCLLLVAIAAWGCRNTGQGYEEGKKNVVLLRYKQGSESTEQRERGFLETLAKEYPDINVMLSSEYAGTTQESALDKAQQVLNKYGEKVDGIFAVCEPNGVGILQALENAKLAGKVKLITFDPSPRLIEAMRDDKVHGIILQDPYRMGYEAVQSLAKHINGEQVEKYIDTGEYVATPENMDGTDENGNDIKQLLSPIQYTDELKAKPESTKLTFAVIPKGTTHEFWKSVHAGAETAAKELGGIEIIWKGPLNEDNTEEQISIVQSFVAQKVSGIVLAPNDSSSLVQAVNEAQKAGIPVVIFDSGLDDASAYVTYVATDNYKGGALAARQMAKALGVEPKAAQQPADQQQPAENHPTAEPERKEPAPAQ
jgi:ABC-type sugar transport system substrate-binding protein